MLGKLGLKQFSKEEFYAFSITTESGRQSPEGMKVLQSAWVLVGPLLYFSTIAYAKDFIDELPKMLLVINSLNIVCFVASIYILLKFNKLTVKLELFQTFMFSFQALVLGTIFLNSGPLYYFSDYALENGRKDFNMLYSPELINKYFFRLNMVIPLLLVITHLYFLFIIKKGQGKKESKRAKKIDYYERVIAWLYPIVTAIAIPILVFTSMVKIVELPAILNLANVCLFIIGCAVIVISVYNYMIFYIKKRFPEEYTVIYKKKSGN